MLAAPPIRRERRREASLPIALRALKAAIALAHATRVAPPMLTAVVRALHVLAPRPVPAVLTHARPTHPIACPVAVALVHAATDRAARRPRRRRIEDGRGRLLTHRLPSRIALAHAIETPPAPGTRWLSIRAGRARAVVAFGTAPSRMAGARAARVIAHAVVVAAARACHLVLARRAHELRLTRAYARRVLAAHAAIVAVAWARPIVARGTRPARRALAHARLPIADAVHAAALWTSHRVANESRPAVPGALGRLTRRPAPAGKAHARAVVARATPAAILWASALGAIRSVPTVGADALAVAHVRRLDAGAVLTRAVVWARCKLARGACARLLAHTLRYAADHIDAAVAVAAARRGARACRPRARGSDPAVEAFAPAAGHAFAARVAAAFVARLVRRARMHGAIVPLPPLVARASAVGHASAMAGATVCACGQLADIACPAVVALAACKHRRVERGEALWHGPQVWRSGRGVAVLAHARLVEAHEGLVGACAFAMARAIRSAWDDRAVRPVEAREAGACTIGLTDAAPSATIGAELDRAVVTGKALAANAHAVDAHPAAEGAAVGRARALAVEAACRHAEARVASADPFDACAMLPACTDQRARGCRAAREKLAAITAPPRVARTDAEAARTMLAA